MLIGSTEEEVARRLGVSAEMVASIVAHRLQDAQCIAPDRVITDGGFDENSLKKRHKLYVTILTDLSDPQSPRILAVAKGRDQAAAEECLKRLSIEQRGQVRTHRTDMSASFTAAGKAQLPHSHQVSIASMWPRNWARRRTASEKETRADLKTLSTKERKAFRSEMWLVPPAVLEPDSGAPGPAGSVV